ncbi:hypothetical protein DENSPDRAFT_298735 [Dentipellis sp. KUC8613]|nr:hypothetical protein DENSPDRAFT_298735 [Dentipellis sp. KUC8613]
MQSFPQHVRHDGHGGTRQQAPQDLHQTMAPPGFQHQDNFRQSPARAASPHALGPPEPPLQRVGGGGYLYREHAERFVSTAPSSASVPPSRLPPVASLHSHSSTAPPPFRQTNVASPPPVSWVASSDGRFIQGHIHRQQLQSQLQAQMHPRSLQQPHFQHEGEQMHHIHAERQIQRQQLPSLTTLQQQHPSSRPLPPPSSSLQYHPVSNSAVSAPQSVPSVNQMQGAAAGVQRTEPSAIFLPSNHSCCIHRSGCASLQQLPANAPASLPQPMTLPSHFVPSTAGDPDARAQYTDMRSQLAGPAGDDGQPPHSGSQPTQAATAGGMYQQSPRLAALPQGVPSRVQADNAAAGLSQRSQTSEPAGVSSLPPSIYKKRKATTPPADEEEYLEARAGSLGVFEGGGLGPGSDFDAEDSDEEISFEKPITATRVRKLREVREKVLVQLLEEVEQFLGEPPKESDPVEAGVPSSIPRFARLILIFLSP